MKVIRTHARDEFKSVEIMVKSLYLVCVWFPHLRFKLSLK